ncbi:hypothetical protein ACFV3I_05580 [Microbacterium sp. NPDC059771]|uniref:hypothetical protein n=1 Tax=Microbacterium sp. NPDC059771 TaxID=3346941 RepID=UPI0036662DD6
MTTPILAIILSVAVTGCSSAVQYEPNGTPTAQSAPVPDTVGTPLDEAWTSLTAVGLTVDAEDVREGRSIWNRMNWVVVTQQVTGQTTVTLGVEKENDPGCWERATNCEWVPVLGFDAAGDAKSEQFELDGGPTRLTYTVSATATAEGKRTADIYFQDVALDTESSYVDTIINVDQPGEGTEDLGARRGAFYVAVSVREHDVEGVAIHVVVEQMRPAGE